MAPGGIGNGAAETATVASAPPSRQVRSVTCWPPAVTVTAWPTSTGTVGRPLPGCGIAWAYRTTAATAAGSCARPPGSTTASTAAARPAASAPAPASTRHRGQRRRFCRGWGCAAAATSTASRTRSARPGGAGWRSSSAATWPAWSSRTACQQSSQPSRCSSKRRAAAGSRSPARNAISIWSWLMTHPRLGQQPGELAPTPVHPG